MGSDIILDPVAIPGQKYYIGPSIIGADITASILDHIYYIGPSILDHIIILDPVYKAIYIILDPVYRYRRVDPYIGLICRHRLLLLEACHTSVHPPATYSRYATLNFNFL